jgi:hypothetical protein
VNLRETGPVEQVSTPEELATTVHGAIIDLDTKLLAPDLIDLSEDSPAIGLYRRHVEGWLDRDPTLRHAEVRFSGGGLHVLVWLAPPVELRSAGDRQRWRGMIKAVQSLLPSDPTAPALTALTRPVGSVNSKTGKAVETLRKGTAVTAEEFRGLYERARDKPFGTIARILHRAERVTPCPVCRVEGRTLLAGGRAGNCYAGCGIVSFAQLLATVMAAPAAKEVRDGR